MRFGASIVNGAPVHDNLLEIINIMSEVIHRSKQPGTPCLVVGVGNTLLKDDGIGIHVTNLLRDEDRLPDGCEIIDGGTIGLALLPAVEDSDALVIVDAAEIGEAPGVVKVFIDEEVDRHLSGKRRSVHEVAIVDLLAAAGIRDSRPRHCALVAVQPESTDWGLEPTPSVQEAIPAACEAIHNLTRRWRHES